MVVVVHRLQRVVHLCALIAGGESGVPFFSLAIPEVLYSRSDLHLELLGSSSSIFTQNRAHPVHFQAPLLHHFIALAKMSAPPLP